MREFILAVAQVDAGQAFCDSWHTQTPEVHVATGGYGFAAWFSGINWAAVASFVAVAVPIAFGVLVQCYKQVRLAQIQIAEAQTASSDRIAARRAGIPPAPASAG